MFESTLTINFYFTFASQISLWNLKTWWKLGHQISRPRPQIGNPPHPPPASPSKYTLGSTGCNWASLLIAFWHAPTHDSLADVPIYDSLSPQRAALWHPSPLPCWWAHPRCPFLSVGRIRASLVSCWHVILWSINQSNIFRFRAHDPLFTSTIGNFRSTVLYIYINII